MMRDFGDGDFIVRRRKTAICLGGMLCFGGVVITSFVWFSLTLSDNSIEAGSPRWLSVDSKLLDLGNVWWTDSVTISLPIYNGGPEAIRVSAVQTSCDCTVVNPSDFTVPSGESVSIEVVMSLPSRRAAAPDLYPFSESVKLLLSGVPARDCPTWNVQGQAIAPLRFEAHEVAFGSALEWGTKYESRRLRIVASPNVSRVDLVSSADDFSVSLNPYGDGDAPGWLMEVQPQHSLPPGRFATEIVVQGYDVDDQPCGMATAVRVTGKVVADVEAHPESLIFGASPVGELSVGRFKLRSRSTSRVRILSIDSSSDDLTGELVDSHYGESPLASHLENDPSGREIGEGRPGSPSDPNSQVDAISTWVLDDQDIERFIEVTHTPRRVGPHDDELRVLVEADCYETPFVVRVPVKSFGQR